MLNPKVSSTSWAGGSLRHLEPCCPHPTTRERGSRTGAGALRFASACHTASEKELPAPGRVRSLGEAVAFQLSEREALVK